MNASIALLFLAILPMLPVWSWPQGLLLVVILLARPLAGVRRVQLSELRFGAVSLVSVMVLVCLVLGIVFVGMRLPEGPWVLRGWLQGDHLVFALALVLALKSLEARQTRDGSLLAYGGLVLLVLGSRYLGGLLALAYLVIGLTVFLLSLQSLTTGRGVSWALLRSIGKLAGLALPLTALLFVTFPRLQGPLWDLVIVLGLPMNLVVDQQQNSVPLKVGLKAGQTGLQRQNNAPVLVAEFSETPPYKSQMYWRGPVYHAFDGREWRLADDWDNRSQLLRDAYKGEGALSNTLTGKSEKVAYEARVSANGSRFLYALDIPVGRSTETFVSGEFQLLAVRPLNSEFNYGQEAYLEYLGGRALTDIERAAYLQWPEGENPRLRAWGESLSQSGGATGEDIVQAVRVHLAEGRYQILPIVDTPPDQPHVLDDFFFDRKTGPVELLAGSVAMALRAAGVPARLVSGYRGGSLIALTNFVVVRQAHAHVWVEAWDDRKGWFRVEPKDFVAPPEPETKAQAAAQPAPKPAAKAASPVAKKTEAPKLQAESRVAATGWSFGWLNRLGAGLETWVLNYNPDRQVELMQKSGLHRVDWKGLLGLTMLGLLALFALYGWLATWRRRPSDPVQRAFETLSRRFAKSGLACQTDECPANWRQRLMLARPELAPAIETVLKQYESLRFGVADEAPPKHTRQKEFIRDAQRLSAMV